MLRLCGVSKSFQSGRRATYVQACRAIDLHLEAGDSLAIVGESGSGKTTLGHILALLTAPDAGHIFFRGRDVTTPDRRTRHALRQEVQLIRQDHNAAFNPFWRIETSMKAPFRMLGRSANAHRIEEVLDAVGLSRVVLGQYPHELSGGQRQRLNIARALTISPRLLVADELTSALDVSVQAHIINLLNSLNTKTGLSLVVITHNLATVPYFASHILVMYQGSVVEAGASNAVFDGPAHPYTRALLDALPAGRKESALRDEGPAFTAERPAGGCVFQLRCPFTKPLCQTTPPPLSRLADNSRKVACYYPLQPVSDV